MYVIRNTQYLIELVHLPLYKTKLDLEVEYLDSANTAIHDHYLSNTSALDLLAVDFSLEKESLELRFKDMEKYWQKCSEIEQLASQITQARRQHSWKKESIEYVVVREMICYLGKRHFDCDNEHFWYEIKKQLFKVIDEASD